MANLGKNGLVQGRLQWARGSSKAMEWFWGPRSRQKKSGQIGSDRKVGSKDPVGAAGKAAGD